MKWKEFKHKHNKYNSSKIVPYGLEKTDIECPECGEYLYKNTLMVLCTYPPQYRYECIECRWHDTAH